MRYFHRTSVRLEDVLPEAERFFGSGLSASGRTLRSRTFSGPIGTIKVTARAEGGHYTLVTVETDQVGEAELDKRAKRFLSTVHQRVEPTHALRGAY